MGGKGIMGTNSIMRTGITRREFVETSAGLVISFYLPAHRRDAGPDPADARFAPNAWLRIGADDVVTLTVDKSEMGQGSQTGLAMILAEEHRDRKSTRLNSSHQIISYAVFCLKKKNKIKTIQTT